MALGIRPSWAMSSTDYSTPIFYTALSYTWGPEVYDGSIVCDGLVKEITKSLEAALQQFRHPHESIMMWIDQICINQKDKNEKAQQIPLMSRIYTLASSTVIWLGEASNGSDSALKLLEQIVSCLQFTFSQPGFGDLENLGLPASGSTDWKHLCELLCREWFTRVWIIQEAVLSPRHLTWIACGDKFLDWEKFTHACIYMETCGIARKLGEMFPDVIPHQRPSGEAISNIESIKSDSGQISLFSALTKTRNANCRFDKDRVYGLLAICKDTDKAAVRVSYESDYTEVDLYTHVTEHFIRGDERSPWMRLSIVLAQAEHESLDMPSWAPDWRKPPLTTALSAPLAYSNVYKACGRFNLDNNRGKPMAKINGGELSTPGFSFDTIVKVSDIFDKPDLSYRDPIAQNATLLASVAFALEMRNGACGDKIFEALWRTLVAGKNDEGISTCPESFAEIFSFLIDQTTGKSPSLPGQTYSARQKLPEGRGRMELHNLSERTLGQTFLQARIALRRALTNRRLGITKNGYLGLFPGHVGKGDSVYVFDRCPLPYVLRSVGSEGRFRFIGECFVYGIMHEEAAWSEEICLTEVTLV